MAPTNMYNRSSRFIPPISQTLGLKNFENKLKKVFDKTLRTCNNENPKINQTSCKVEKSCHIIQYPTTNEMRNKTETEVSEIETCIRNQIAKKVKKRNVSHKKIIVNHINKNEYTSKVHPNKQNKKYLNAFARNQVIEVLEAASMALKSKSDDVYI